MFKIVIICEDHEEAQAAKLYFQNKYSLIPAYCIITAPFVDDTLVEIRNNEILVHAIIDVDGNVTTKQLQELIDNNVEYYFVRHITSLDQAKSFGSCNHPL